MSAQQPSLRRRTRKHKNPIRRPDLPRSFCRSVGFPPALFCADTQVFRARAQPPAHRAVGFKNVSRSAPRRAPGRSARFFCGCSAGSQDCFPHNRIPAAALLFLFFFRSAHKQIPRAPAKKLRGAAFSAIVIMDIIKKKGVQPNETHHAGHRARPGHKML